MKKVVTFGELMMRLSPTGDTRFSQTNSCQTGFGGSEANVAVALARYGLESVFVSKLPNNVFGKAAHNAIRKHGVKTSFIANGGNRLGIYLAEKGLKPCATICTYDRLGSSFAEAKPSDFDWDEIFDGAGWFHFSGITPAIGENMTAILLEACQKAKTLGITVSCDVNYRSKLWSMEDASKAMRKLCQFVDVLIVNEEEARVLGVDVSGENLTHYADFCRMTKELEQIYPCSTIASVARINHDTEVKAMLWKGSIIQSQAYPINAIDPIGAGDAFAASLIYGLILGYSPEYIVNFAAACCAAKHSIKGDFYIAEPDEIEVVMKLGSSGVQR